MELNAKHYGGLAGVLTLGGALWSGGVHVLGMLNEHEDAKIHAALEDYSKAHRQRELPYHREADDSSTVLNIIVPTLPKREQELINMVRNAEAQRIRQEGN